MHRNELLDRAPNLDAVSILAFVLAGSELGVRERGEKQRGVSAPASAAVNGERFAHHTITRFQRLLTALAGNCDTFRRERSSLTAADHRGTAEAPGWGGRNFWGRHRRRERWVTTRNTRRKTTVT